MTNRKTEIKRLKRLEKILLVSSITGISLAFAAKSTNHEKLASVLGGATSISAIAGSSISEYRKALQDYLKIYKENYESKIKLENEHKAGLEDNQRLIIK